MAPLRGLRDPSDRTSSLFSPSKPKLSRNISSREYLPVTWKFSDSEKPKQSLENLLHELDTSSHSDDLTHLQQRLCIVIDEYPVQNVLRVFASVQRLLHSNEDNQADFGLAILAKLAFKPECTPANRLYFFSSIVRDGPTKRFSDFPSYIFSILSDDGRQIDGFEPLLPYLIPFLLTEADRELADRDPRRTTAHESGVLTTTSLDLVINIVKYNARFLDDASITDLVRGIFDLRQRLAYDDLEKVCDILATLLIYSYVPDNAVQSVTRILCFEMSQSAGHQRPELRAKTIKTFALYLRTHLKDQIIENLLCGFEHSGVCPEEASGAAALLEWSLTDAATRQTIELDINRLMDALAISVSAEHASAYASFRLDLIEFLLKDDEVRQKILALPDWIHVQQAIVQNAKAPLESGSVPLNKEDGSLNRFMQEQAHRRETIQDIVSIMEHLQGISLQQSRVLRRIALHAAPWLTQKQAIKLISAYQPSSFRISVGNWLSEFRELASSFVFKTECNLTLRQRALKVVKSAWRTAQQLGEDEAVAICRQMVIDALSNETNYVFRGNLVHCLLNFTWGVDDAVFHETVEILLKAAQTDCYHEPLGSPLSFKEEGTGDTTPDTDNNLERESQVPFLDEELPSVLPDAGLVVLLMRSSVDHLERSRWVYSEILRLISIPSRPPEATVMLLRGMFRIRSDLDHRIFFLPSSEGESLARVLNRNADAPMQQSRRSSLQSGLSIGPPVWKYGDIHGLPEDPPATVSSVLRSQPDISQNVEYNLDRKPWLDKDGYLRSNPGDDIDRSLDMKPWLDTVIQLIASGCDWEVYSYIIVHLGPQVSNQSLFVGNVAEIRQLRNLICKQIQSQTLVKPPEASNLRQGDVAICLYHILTTCIGYHWRFPRKENEDTVSTFVRGLTMWERTTVPCVNALTLSCYELPLSLSRDLMRIVAQMSTIVTKQEAAIHVLEFLAGLSRIEILVNQFHGDEIKTVFGVCFSYIEYARGRQYDEAQQRTRQTAPGTRNSSIVEAHHRPSAEDLPQYVFALSYHIITFWFLALENEDQKKHFPWMEQRLLSPDQLGNVPEEALATVDHLWRVAEGKYIPQPQNLEHDLARASSAEPVTQSWVSDYCILTIKCYLDTGVVEATERRSSGTDESRFVYAGEDPLSPDVVFRERFSKTINGTFHDAAEPCILPTIDATRRALGIFDRTSPMDYFKCGVIYIGENQTREADILCNVSGSPDYNVFVSGLGERLELLNCRENVAGLDTSEGLFDGRSTYRHSDSVTTLNYHITTMMPTNREMDPQCTRKKSHIGNDYVNIVFNNSGLDFDFNTFPSAFNYVYIVVTPEARQTFIQTRTRSHNEGWYEDSWFNVRLLTRPDFPAISSAAETMVVSGAALSSYVRNLALNAEEFCRVWGTRGHAESLSSWRSRLQQIRMLRERYAPKEA